MKNVEITENTVYDWSWTGQVDFEKAENLTKGTLAEAKDAVVKVGGHVTLYINGTLRGWVHPNGEWRLV